uniref:Pyruvate dehydrogenase E1 component subunit alpha n=1 Tax=Parascaris univalens TaxID=6257 RepID=A0A915A054_PARUN
MEIVILRYTSFKKMFERKHNSHVSVNIILFQEVVKKQTLSLGGYGQHLNILGLNLAAIKPFAAMNIAKLWNIPVVYVCENNGYGFGTSTKRACAAKHYYDRVSYMPGVWVDGMDVLAVREAARWAKEWCNGGKGPLILEMSTYRYGGHSVADPGTSYRTRDEVEEVRRTRDAINAFKEKVITAGLVAEDELKEIDRKIRKEVDEAAKMARTGKEATTDLLLTDLYHNTPPQVVRCTTDYVRQPYTNSSEACRALG